MSSLYLRRGGKKHKGQGEHGDATQTILDAGGYPVGFMAERGWIGKWVSQFLDHSTPLGLYTEIKSSGKRIRRGNRGWGESTEKDIGTSQK